MASLSAHTVAPIDRWISRLTSFNQDDTVVRCGIHRARARASLESGSGLLDLGIVPGLGGEAPGRLLAARRGVPGDREVGARFALDGMPGKQLAIDSDMSAGAIDHEEAKRRRETEQAETTFLGSLDGASKFVKGDAIAGLLITALNLVMGLIMGMLVHGLDVGNAFETYAILTIGDGLVTQIPAVIISCPSSSTQK